MKRLLKWIALTGLTIAISLGISLGLSLQLSTETIAQMEENSIEAASTCTTNSDIRVEQEVEIVSNLFRPIAATGSDGHTLLELYCVEPGAALRTTGLSRESVLAYNGRTTHARCGCASFTYLRSDPYYFCTGNHYSESYSGYIENSGQPVRNLYDVGYIISYYPEGHSSFVLGDSWGGAKQQAVWWTALSSHYETRITPYYDSAKLIRKDSLNYQDFYQKIVKEDENGRTGMKPVDNTNVDEVKLDTDDTTDTHILGPFKVDYITGRYQDRGEALSFGGIHDMYLIDEDGNRVEIDMLIRPEQEESYKEPDYWTHIDYKYDKVEGIENPNKVDYYDIQRNYPDPNEPFYVEFKYTGDDVSSLKLHIDFQYMKATSTVCMREGYYYHTYDRHSHSSHQHCSESGCTSCYSCTIYWGVRYDDTHQQSTIYVADSQREIIDESIEIPLDKYLEKTMKLGGYVFEDTPQTKETAVNGIMDDGDRIIPGAEVTLYEIDENGNYKLAKLATLREENPNATDDEVNNPDDYTRRINPTLSDAHGYYEFRGLDTEKHYFVVFSYNGQTYMPTEYLTNISTGESYNAVADMVDQKNPDKYDSGGNISEIWRQTSKTLEVASERDEFDQRFAEIRSYPENYESTNSLNLRLINRNNGYNTTFSIYDLAGFNLTADGTYEQVHESLIDTHYYIDQASGMIMEGDTINEGLITTRIREFIDQNRRYPTDDEMKNTIYQGIVNELSGDVEGGDDEVWRMLQFIEDCKINAYTINNMNDAKSYDLYPVYDQFTTYVASGNKYPNNSYSNGTHDANASTYEDHTIRKNDTYITFKNIYQGQLFVNCGLWRRQETDMALRKDVYKAALKINDKTVVYNYDKRNNNNGDGEGTNNGDGNQDNQTYWDINVRMSDYNGYYAKSYSEDGNAGYMREIYNSDYIFNTSGGIGQGHPGDPLEVYITYKITVRNQSMSILTEIEEVVDYYDKEYTFKPNLSWVMWREGNSNPNPDAAQYYDMMEQDQQVIDSESTSALDFIDNARDAQAREKTTEKYSGTEKNLGDGYQNVYVNGLQDKKLASGESAYIYLTFQVNKTGDRIILDENSDPKENLAEINGYTTYYDDNTQLPNHIIKSSNDIAGLIDRDSTPGNLEEKDLQGDKYEQNFEDDTDRAPSLRIKIDEEAIRKANGIVWEDERTENVGDAVIGDGIRQDKETTVAGVTVELIEKCIDGSEYSWGTATTNNAGQYNFENYIPGDYVIRFRYGNTKDTALSTESKGDKGSNIVSYNGQDFKSTTYQDGIEQAEYTDVSHRYQGYLHTDTQNVTATYNDKENKDRPTNDTFGYDISAADTATANGENYSDAKDLWTAGNRGDLFGRDKVIEYSSNNVTNHKAEVLASPYEVPTYNGTEYSDEEMRTLYDELIRETQMTAETGMIVVEFEYDRQETDGQNNLSNGADDYKYGNDYNSNYTLNNIDFGLTERPKAQLEIDKSVANVKVTLANGSILFDINGAANNALWQDHKEYSIDEHIKDGMYEEYYGNDNKHRYSFRDEIDKDVAGTDKGLIQLTMDEELMHGATIQITYTVKITNVGEVDYVDNDATKDFYYRGDTSGTTVSTTVANQVVDYVQNNLTFDENNEANNGSNKKDGWKLITVEDLTNHSDVNQDLVNKKLESGENNKKLSAFNTIVQTESFGRDNLQPGQETTRTIILSQLITPENTNDDLTYGNMVEIVKTSNSVGRRMAYSVVGNQDPSLNDASEVDANVAERIVILPPFGEVRIYYILAGVVAVMLIGGIILIRRKVLKGK